MTLGVHPHPSRFIQSLPTSLRGPQTPWGRRERPRGRQAVARRKLRREYRNEHTHKPDPKKPRERKVGSPSFREWLRGAGPRTRPDA